MALKIDFKPQFRKSDGALNFRQKLNLLRKRDILPVGPLKIRAGDNPGGNLADLQGFINRSPSPLPPILEDVQAIFDNDPAAKNIFEVMLYQGLWAIISHRLAHALYKENIPFFPRLISQFSRFFTQIEIHPGATIGKCFFIDHGSGVVIGETSEIGNNVIMYQGASLAGTGKGPGKRHPTIGNNVIIGAGAKVMGSFTVGDNVRIGAGAVVVKSVPPNTTVVGNPAWIVRSEGRRLEPLEHGALPDPVQKALGEIQARIEKLERKD